jgi:hypothetical protein
MFSSAFSHSKKILDFQYRFFDLESLSDYARTQVYPFYRCTSKDVLLKMYF